MERTVLGPGRRPAAPLLVAAACAGGLVVVYALFVHTTVGQRVDNAALLGRAAVPQGLVDDAWGILDTISLVALAAASLAVGLVALIQGRVRQAFGAGVILLGANVTTQVLKRVILTRPELVRDDAIPFNSLPSGHATVAMSVAIAALVVVPAARRPLVALLGTGYAVAVGVSTLVAGWHRPSDAVAAYLVVGAWAALVAPFAGDRAPSGRTRMEALLWMGSAAMVLGVLAGGAALAGVTASSEFTEFAGFGRRSLAFLSAALGIAATATTVTAMVMGMLRSPWPARRP